MRVTQYPYVHLTVGVIALEELDVVFQRDPHDGIVIRLAANKLRRAAYTRDLAIVHLRHKKLKNTIRMRADAHCTNRLTLPLRDTPYSNKAAHRLLMVHLTGTLVRDPKGAFTLVTDLRLVLAKPSLLRPSDRRPILSRRNVVKRREGHERHFESDGRIRRHAPFGIPLLAEREIRRHDELRYLAFAHTPATHVVIFVAH